MHITSFRSECGSQGLQVIDAVIDHETGAAGREIGSVSDHPSGTSAGKLFFATKRRAACLIFVPLGVMVFTWAWWYFRPSSLGAFSFER
ncbi:hypothetical protein [Xanthomonas sp. NCPPB 2632]|uniref:hypothetical protein n=1 Tax=Xanthomonas sp. NCPPB 2632 TaxID=3240912 RepID=UPI0035193EF6